MEAYLCSLKILDKKQSNQKLMVKFCNIFLETQKQNGTTSVGLKELIILICNFQVH